MHIRYFRLFSFLVLAELASACGAGGPSPAPVPPAAGPPGAALPAADAVLSHAAAPAVAVAAGVAINAGGPAAGPDWRADTGYTLASAGGVQTISKAINTSRVASPAPQAVYLSQRWAAHMSYTIGKLTPLAPYRVRLHFVESHFAATGKRLFDATINGFPVLTNFDIYKAAGGANVAVVEQFSANANSSGTIAIKFDASANNASIAGVEIVAAAASAPSPSPTPATHYKPSAPAAPKLALDPNPFAVKVCSSDPCKPAIDPNSTTYNANFFGSVIAHLGRVGPNVPGDAASQGFDAIPIYASDSADPAYTLKCANGVKCNNYQGAPQAAYSGVHIPNGALADSASAQDYLFDVIDSASNIEYNAFEFNTGGAAANNGTMNALRGGAPSTVYSYHVGSMSAKCFSYGPNYCFNGSAGSTPQSADAVDPVEWLDQNIPHTLHMVPSCAGKTWVYPAADSTGSGPSGCPPFGEMLWLDKTDAEIEAMRQPRWVKTLYHNLHDYGWIVLDDAPCGSKCVGADNSWYLQIVSDYSWTAVGKPSQWQLMEQEMIAEGTTPVKIGTSPTWHDQITTPVDPSITPANLHWLQYKSAH